MRVPTQDDIRWQLNTAAAHGYTGFMWFYLYENEFDPWWGYRGSPINVWLGGKKTALRFVENCALRQSVMLMGEVESAMEEAERKKRAARKAKEGGHPKPEQGAARAGELSARGAGRSLEETPFEPSAPEQGAAQAGKPSAPEQDAAEAGKSSAPEQDPARAEGKGGQTEEEK